MAERTVKTIAVDKKFFENIFEPKRKKLQKQLGLMNLSQAKFTKMIKIKVIQPKQNISNFKIRRKNNGFTKI